MRLKFEFCEIYFCLQAISSYSLVSIFFLSASIRFRRQAKSCSSFAVLTSALAIYERAVKFSQCRLLTHKWCSWIAQDWMENCILFNILSLALTRSLHNIFRWSPYIQAQVFPGDRVECMQNSTFPFEIISNVTSDITLHHDTLEVYQWKTSNFSAFHSITQAHTTELCQLECIEYRQWIWREKSHSEKFTFLCLYYQQANEQAMIIFYIVVCSVLSSPSFPPSCMSSYDGFFFGILLLPTQTFFCCCWCLTLWQREIYNLNRIDFNTSYLFHILIFLGDEAWRRSFTTTLHIWILMKSCVIPSEIWNMILAHFA